MTSARYVIIGNSIAAINAIEGIRERDNKGDILIISDEEHPIYSRPLITYYLCDKVGDEGLLYRPSSFHADYNVLTMLGRRAVRLDTGKRMVVLDDDTKVGFEKLLIATGGTPIIPDVPGKDLQGTFTFTTLDDSLCLKRFITDHDVKRVVVVGGGLIGLKVTEALLALSIKVVIVELADRILSATFDLTASRMIERALNTSGCTIITQNTVQEIREGEKGRVGTVLLKGDRSIDCDAVIMAIGVRPRLDLATGTTITTDKGILVDRHLRTGAEDIYAAGDVIECNDCINNIRRPIAILPNAAKQGRVAGCNMAGGSRIYEGCMAMNSIELAGIPTISVGLTDPSLLPDEKRRKGIEVLQDSSDEDSVYKKIVIEKNRIIGVIMIGRIDRAGIYTGLIRDKVDISSFKDLLLRDDFGLLSLPREYRKHIVVGQGIEV
ncbi:MAG: NAD(P)/FAD-dependent oxidoreductase [bacterium]